MKKLLSILAAFAIIFTLTGCGDKEEQQGESKKLVVYSPNSDGLVKATIPLFEEKYGIDVELISAGTGELLKRVQGEANNPQGDVFFGGSVATMMLHPELFEPYVSSHNDELIDIYQNKEGFITCYVLDGSVLLVNKTLAGKYNIKGYKDLLNPELSGKIVSANPAASSSAYAHLTNMLLAMGGYESEDAWKYVEDLWNNGVVTIDSSSAVWKGVRDGEYAVGLSYEDPSATLVRDGADVEVVYMEEGTVFLPASTCIIKGCKNLDNAKLFVDFITSKEVQDIYGTTLTNRPVYDGAATADFMTPMKDIKLLEEDTQYCSENKETIRNRFTEIYVDSQGK